jgi:hypothetical protein
VYVVAFASLGVQIAGLVGDAGILPADAFLGRVAQHFGAGAAARLPTLCWLLGADTRTLQLLCIAGIACGTALIVGLLPGPAALLAWALYLSLVGVGQVFLGFQWDALLLETGLLALLVAPWRWRPRRYDPSIVALLPLWCLVFKLHLLSGWVKLAGGDPTWWNCTALEYHYWTTCLPVWIGWYAAQLPDLVQRASVLVMFAIELGAPFAILGPRRLRHAAAGAMIALQLGIAATGNYGFFNLLTIALCLTLLDDAALVRLLPVVHVPPHATPRRPVRVLAGAAALAASALTLLPMAERLLGARTLPLPALVLLEALEPLRSFNTYGPVRQHDDRATRDHPRRLRRWQHLGGVRVSLEAGRSAAAAGVRRAPHASPRLANVVRGAAGLRAHALVRAVPRPLARERSGRDGPARAGAVRRPSAALHSRRALSLRVRHAGGAPHGCLVAPRAARTVRAGAIAPGALSVSVRCRRWWPRSRPRPPGGRDRTA